MKIIMCLTKSKQKIILKKYINKGKKILNNIIKKKNRLMN